MTDAGATADPLLGLEVGRFRLTRLLGRGGMGRVYLGVHPGIGSRVAIKVLAEDLSHDADLLERFFTEARAVNLIRHENIVAITDLNRLPGGRPYIVMEFIDGMTLRGLLQAHPGLPLPLGGVARALNDTLHALEAAHAAGIVHRDLKPDNVILTASGRAKVLDFGIAKLVDAPTHRTATGVALGTPHYMAPEQIIGRECDGRTDVYAAGVMLYELVTGWRPFEAATDFALMEAQVRTAPPDVRAKNRALPEAIAVVIERALAKEPAARFATARAMADALAAALEPLADEDAPGFAAVDLRPAYRDDDAVATARSPAPRSSETATVPGGSAPKSGHPELDPGDQIATVADRTPVPASRGRGDPAAPRASRLGSIVGALGLVALAAAAALVLGHREHAVAVAVTAPPRDAALLAADAAVVADATTVALVTAATRSPPMPPSRCPPIRWSMPRSHRARWMRASRA